jgi:hypothetical protein
VEKGENLIIPKKAAHWQRHEDELLYEHAFVAEYQVVGQNIRIAERFNNIQVFKLETGIVLQLVPYQD